MNKLTGLLFILIAVFMAIPLANINTGVIWSWLSIIAFLAIGIVKLTAK